MQPIGLYYPYVHVQNDVWLKTAALYWPKLARVVADGYPVRDSATATALGDGLGFWEDLDPKSAATAIKAPFLSVISEHAAALRRLYAIRPEQLRGVGSADPSLRRGHRVNRYAPPPAPGDTVGPRRATRAAELFWDEVSPDLREALINEGLALNTDRPDARSGYVESHWISMDPMLAWVYKCALTHEIASRNPLHPTTDQIAAHQATQAWDPEQIAAVLLGSQARPSEEPAAGLLGQLAVQTVLPDNIAQIPVQKIVELRKRHDSEFSAFMGAVSLAAKDVQEELVGIESPKILASYLDHVRQEHFQKPLDDLKAAMKSLKIDTAFGAMNVQTQLPAISGALGGLAIDKPYVTALGVAYGLLGIRHSAAKQRDQLLADSPVSYLLRVEQGLEPSGLIRRVTGARLPGARRGT
ncbi:hypothetical protein H9Y04_17305 [Streptomyces sp. TRM66268-LWL]|uniref:Uncharacterized protein n=1 Tax=Streptomyces polyasparticus TaxID=2767826 RepID=A0ABR7SFP6_9ACTN|nr:DUF6236 family protein [Streptomyces polyasparticus]MBC9714320.1 hypothetical protein [Streptomyces polyasparticus]